MGIGLGGGKFPSFANSGDAGCSPLLYISFLPSQQICVLITAMSVNKTGPEALHFVNWF